MHKIAFYIDNNRIADVDCSQIADGNPGIDFLNSVGIDSTLTVDPTFLLSADYWREISDRQTIKKINRAMY